VTEPEPSELSWIIWPAGAGWKQFGLCATGPDPDFIVAVTTETAHRIDEALGAAAAAAEERGRRKAIADLRDTAAFHNWQADHGRYEGDRTELIDYLESLDRSGT
jgi:hypothetical protein